MYSIAYLNVLYYINLLLEYVVMKLFYNNTSRLYQLYITSSYPIVIGL